MKAFCCLLSLIVCALIIQSCGSSYVSVPVTRPSEVNLIKYKNVCVGEFGGHRVGRNLHIELTNALIGSGKVNVLDHQALDRLLFENELTLAGLILRENSDKLTKLLGAAAIISGRVLTYDFDQDVQKGSPYADKNGKTHHDFVKVGTAKVKINFKITDLTNGQIIFSRNFERTVVGKNSATDEYPPDVKAEEQFSIARENIVREFTRCILPYTERINVEFLTDSDLPELEQGVELIRRGAWEDGIARFLLCARAVRNNETLAKAYYDLGLAYQYTYTFDKAHEAFSKACALVNEQRYFTAATRCRIMEEEQRRLEYQLKNVQE